MSKPYRSRNEIVGTTKRSIAAIPSAWLRRKVVQPWDGGRLRRAMYLATLVCPTSMPSLSSSPWIRGAPHSGLARQLAYLRRHLWPSPAGSRFPAPIGSEPSPVPADHGIRLDDRQRAPNIGEQPIKTDQYQSVGATEEKPFWRGPPQH